MRRPLAATALAAALAALPPAAAAQGDAKRGEYLAAIGGCLACHTEAAPGARPYAGGRALATPFGTFYGPNITPHPKAGIGTWSEADFVRAMRLGLRPDGAHYYPVFPFPSYTKLTDADLRDLWAFLRTLPPSERPNRPHELKFPYGYRFPLAGWKWLFFKPGAFVAPAGLSEPAKRGAYLVQGPGHCGECHTPRNVLGGPRQDRYLAGGKGPEGKNVPNLTPTRLKKWSDADLAEYLRTAMTPDGDVAAEAMAEVVRNATSKLTEADMAAVIAYLRSLPPLESEKAR